VLQVQEGEALEDCGFLTIKETCQFWNRCVENDKNEGSTFEHVVTGLLVL